MRYLLLLIALMLSAPCVRAQDGAAWWGVVEAAGSAELWTPADMTNNQALWFDMADLDTMWSDTNGTVAATNGGVCARIDDKSGNGINVYQNTGAKQPTVTTGGLLFDGTDDWFESTASFTAQFFLSYVKGGTAKNWMGMFTATTSECILGGSGDLLPFSGGTVWVNGVTSTTYNANTSFLWGLQRPTASNKERVLGVEYNSRKSSRAWPGYIGEVLCLTASPTLEIRNKLEGYLAWKWDKINGDTVLVTGLPSAHPYKSAAPTQ